MGRRRSFDIEEAVDTATRLFWRGYDKTSMADLTGAMGIAPTSFYFAFGSKETLFRHVVDRYVASQADAFERAFQAFATADGVKALLRGYVDVVTDPGHAPGCLVVNNSPSTDGSDALRQWLAGIREALRHRLEDQFCADRAQGKLPWDFDPKAMARFVVTLAGGLAVEAESGAGRNDLYAVIEFAMRNFAACVTDAEPPSVRRGEDARSHKARRRDPARDRKRRDQRGAESMRSTATTNPAATARRSLAGGGSVEGGEAEGVEEPAETTAVTVVGEELP